MASNRLQKLGTIYSRITGLLRSGAIKFEDKPLWYTIYQAFPPKYQPRFDRPAPTYELRKIFYEEDVIRAKFHKQHPKLCGSFNLKDRKNKTNTQLFIEKYKQLEGTMSDKEIMSTVVSDLETMKPKPNISTNEAGEPATPLATAFKKAQPVSVNLKQILQDK